MKNLFIIAIFIALPLLALQAQDMDTRLNTAKSEYKSGNYENARFELQQALMEINQAVGRDILEMLPDKLAGMDKIEDQDNVTGVSNNMFGGLFVNRYYKAENRDASVEIVGDSPMIGSLNVLLNMPNFMVSDPNQKRIKVDGQKALLTKNTDEENNVNYEVQMIFGSTLYTLNCNGIDSENEVTSMLEIIPFKKIMNIAR
jgi:hypothetical protein